MRNYCSIAILSLALLSAVTASASQVTFNFTNAPGGGDNAPGNSLSMTVGGVTVAETAWSLASTTSNTDFFKAALDDYNGTNLGPGVCSASDPSGAGCSSPYDQIDNSNTSGRPSTNGPDEFVMFQFSTPIQLSGGGLTITNYAPIDGFTNVNLTYYTASTSLTTSTALSTLGTGMTINANGGSGEPITDAFSSGNDVTYLVVGASVPDAQAGSMVDSFKLNSLAVQTGSISVATAQIVASPEPATLVLIGLGLLGFGIYGRKLGSKH
jgi:hypothetical protein